MKLKENFYKHEIGNETYIIDITGQFSGLVRCNPTSSFVLDQLKEDVSVEQIVDKMFETYEVSREKLESDVNIVIETLRKMNALEEK